MQNWSITIFPLLLNIQKNHIFPHLTALASCPVVVSICHFSKAAAAAISNFIACHFIVLREHQLAGIPSLTSS